MLADVRPVPRWGPTGHPVSVVVFDGDDTLWLTEHLYDAAREAARAVVERAGASGELWERLQRTIDVQNVELLGHSPRRFPTSCVEAFREAVPGARFDPEGDVADAVWEAAEAVFTATAPLRPDALGVLTTLAGYGIRLALLTKGDPDVQARRILESGLAPAFEALKIVPEKTRDSFRSLIEEMKAHPSEAVSVGNSVHSDVLPALDAGLEAIWLPAHVWEFERQRDDLVPERVQLARELTDVLSLLGLPAV